MVDDARIDAGAAAYRGFLFSDMRGFTAFAERYGNTAAAAKVSRFLEIARRAIARHEGAEIKTEGDAIHAVFPSASSAVLCGLEIVEAAAELNAQEPDRPLGMGVGIHAGEAVETAEGYIGRAVNIAARLCAVARPGEVLVSSTVKGITQASIPVGFIPQGRRRLKGIQDPILVYAVTRDMNARAPRDGAALRSSSAPPAWPLRSSVGIAVVASQFGDPARTRREPDRASAAPLGPARRDRTAGHRDLHVGAVPAAGHLPDRRTRAGRPIATGRRCSACSATIAPRGSLYFLRVQEVIENPCVQGGEGAETGLARPTCSPSSRSSSTSTSETRSPSEVGGFPGQRVDVTVSDGVLAACGGMAGGEAAIFRAGDEVWSASPGERFRLISVVVGDQAVTIVMSTDWTQIPSVQELENLLERGQRVIDSVEF